MKTDELRTAFEAWCQSGSPKWSIKRTIENGPYDNELTQRFWYEWICSQPPCEHGHVGFCYFCESNFKEVK